MRNHFMALVLLALFTAVAYPQAAPPHIPDIRDNFVQFTGYIDAAYTREGSRLWFIVWGRANGRYYVPIHCYATGKKARSVLAHIPSNTVWGGEAIHIKGYMQWRRYQKFPRLPCLDGMGKYGIVIRVSNIGQN